MLLGLLLVTAGCSGAGSSKSASEPPQTVASPAATQQPLPSLTIAPTTRPDPQTSKAVQQYLSKLAAQGFSAKSHGVWMQSGGTLLANHQGTTPLSAASLTKVATSLAALQTFGPDHRFETLIGTTGTIENGILKGDLIVQGQQDPFFVWEEAIAVGNLLNELQIRQVTGNVIVVGGFYMNYELDPQKSGALLKQGINAQSWSEEAKTQYLTLPPGTSRPQVAIAGSVRVASSVPASTKPLVRHRSLPLAELLKKMNRYSNNLMAEIIASSVGGAKLVSYKAAQAAGVPQSEILLVNGSGLAVENRISPRAVCAMFLAIERYLQPMKLTVADVFTVVGKDTGILDERQLPTLAVTKSGSLDAVSALAGALPTQKQGIVWFVIMNGGGANLEGFRSGQEALLQTLSSQWGTVQTSPTELSVNGERSSQTSLSEAVN
jgi:serine-type D-Ala-D-Ala carboxypeptidase/endopeptidase (penicillin-binding protein 4)